QPTPRCDWLPSCITRPETSVIWGSSRLDSPRKLENPRSTWKNAGGKQILILPNYGGFRVSATFSQKARKRKRTLVRERHPRLLRERQRRILDRTANHPGSQREVPMITASNIHSELGARVQALSAGGRGALLLLARTTGLVSAIDLNLHLLKRHLPDHE